MDDQQLAVKPDVLDPIRLILSKWQPIKPHVFACTHLFVELVFWA